MRRHRAQLNADASEASTAREPRRRDPASPVRAATLPLTASTRLARRHRRELYGRVLVVFAAQHYASQLVLANSQRRGSVLPRSHKDIARKAFERVTKSVLPASHVRLQRALAAEARNYSAKIGELDKRSRGQRASEADGDDSVLGNDGQVADDD
ncbi:MAG: hypothetical protein LC790_00420 [Actinobacteria bacterium]|nr:hypothetical protein [Actinomycetota bacterium]